MGHGNKDASHHYLCVGNSPSSSTWASDTQIESAFGRYRPAGQEREYEKLVLVLETCYSGGLIDEIGGEDTLVITAASADDEAMNGGGGAVFSSSFTPRLSYGDSFHEAFLEGCESAYEFSELYQWEPY